MNNQIQSIIAKYNELQPENGNSLTPRTGFYLITEVFEISKHVSFYQAKALWKEHQHEAFIEGTEVVIQLTSLKETSPDPAGFDPESLTGKVVHVQSTFPSEIKYKGKLHTIIKSIWVIDNSPIIISRPRISFLELVNTLGLNQTLDGINDSMGDEVLSACKDAEEADIDMLYAYDSSSDNDYYSWDADSSYNDNEEDNDSDEEAVPDGDDF